MTRLCASRDSVSPTTDIRFGEKGAFMKRQGSVGLVMLLTFAVTAILPVQAQTFTVLHQFVGSDGSGPTGTLALDKAGNLYGTTTVGGTETYGVVYKVDKSDDESVLLDFDISDGAFPGGGLIQDKAGNFYGTADEGPGGSGVIFRISPEGKEKLLFAFQGCTCKRVRVPSGALLMDASGNLYGTTLAGGKGNCLFGCGAIYKLDTAGKLDVLYEFTGGKDGNYAVGPLVQDTAGNLYGIAVYGGDLSCPQEVQYGCGTVFKLTPSGKFTVLHAFTGGSDGALPAPGLLLDKAGNLYGAAGEGGSTNCEDPSGPPIGCGTLFKLSANGKFTVLHTFTGDLDGNGPNGGLIQDPEGNLYGTTETGTTNSFYGAVFELKKTGKMIVLHQLNGNTDGATPLAGLIRDSAGNLYGTAYTNFTLFNINGTVFKVKP
jgi:uncharacterized repeat protein (TIGR03803 family)